MKCICLCWAAVLSCLQCWLGCLQGVFHNFVSTSRMPLGVFGQGAVVKEVLSRGHIVKCQKRKRQEPIFLPSQTQFSCMIDHQVFSRLPVVPDICVKPILFWKS